MILTRLKQLESELSPSEQKVARYILSFSKEAVRKNIQEIAEASDTSASAVTRLCKRIGIKGFSELKVLIAEDIAVQAGEEQPFYVPNFSDTDDEETLVSNLLKSVSMNIEMIPALLSLSELKKSAERLLSSKHILLLGIGASHIVAEDFSQKCLRIGILASCPSEEDLILLAASALSSDDTAVIISYSGETPVIKKAAKEAKAHGAEIVAITRFGTSSLSSAADYVLNVPAVESVFRQGATMSRLSQLIVVDALYSSMLIKLNNSRELIEASFGVIRDEHLSKHDHSDF